MLFAWWHGTDHWQLLCSLKSNCYILVFVPPVSLASWKYWLLLLLEFITGAAIAAQFCGNCLERCGCPTHWADPHAGSQEVSADSAFFPILWCVLVVLHARASSRCGSKEKRWCPLGGLPAAATELCAGAMGIGELRLDGVTVRDSVSSESAAFGLAASTATSQTCREYRMALWKCNLRE